MTDVSDMTLEDAINLAHTVAETAHAEDGAGAATTKATNSSVVRGRRATDISAPMFLHERELGDASGRNPFGEEPFERLRYEQRTEILRALSIVLCTMIATRKAMRVPEPDLFEEPADPVSKRPLKQYLERVEKEAILEALREAGKNHAEAARLLGITYRALRYRLDTLRIHVR
jgi:transcriptional regulator with GAF, ATPase, and Fis domain